MPVRTSISNASLVPKQKEELGVKPLAHEKGAFKKGDKVLIKLKPNGKVVGWSPNWSPEMDNCLGKVGVVMNDSDSMGLVVTMLGTQRTWSFPSCSLRVVCKKKRVRVGPGPWDAAPCPHLRWSLMGFFREKLVIVKQEGGPTDCTIRCEKCKTEMTLKAK